MSKTFNKKPALIQRQKTSIPTHKFGDLIKKLIPAKEVNPSNEGGWSDKSLDRRLDHHASLDPTNRINVLEQAVIMGSGGNRATGEEDQYWRAYLGLNNSVPRMNPKAKTSWDDQIEAEKVANGELPSDFYGTTPRMDLNIQAIADTLNTGNLYRNYDKYKEQYPELPAKWQIEEIYNTGKKVLDNPNTWQQVDGDRAAIKEKLDLTTNEENPLGMLAHFGMMWNPDEKAIYVHDTYDFPFLARTLIGNRPKEMKIRGRISFDPKKGSKLLRDNMKGFNDYPEAIR